MHLSKTFSSSFPTHQMIHNVEIERVRVPLIYYCPSSSIYPLSVMTNNFFMTGVVTNSQISEKLVFHVVVPHEFQSRGKIMKNWWFLMYLSIPDV